jgi:hypothetical protein
MCVASTQASRFVCIDGRSRALVGSRLASRSDCAPGAVNSTSWLGQWDPRHGRLLQLEAKVLMNECSVKVCWGRRAWLGATTSIGRASAPDLRVVPGKNEDLESVLGQNYSSETRATLLGRYHSAEWGTRRAHDLEKTPLDWRQKVATPDRTGALMNRPLRHRIWRRYMYNVTLSHYTRRENFGLHVCIPVRTNFYVGWMSEVRCAYHLGRDSKAHNIGPTCRALQDAARNVLLSIIRNEVVVRA